MEPASETPLPTPDKKPQAATNVEKAAAEERVATSLESINQELKKNNLNQQVPDTEASRFAVTGTIIYAGMKFGTGLGAKLGLLVNSLRILANRFDKNTPKLPPSEFLTETAVSSAVSSLIGGGIGGVIGAVVMGIFGYKGADKLKDPDQIIRNPFKAFGIIFSSLFRKKTPTPEPAVNTLQPVEEKNSRPSSQPQNTSVKNWRADAEKRAEEADLQTVGR